MPEFRVQPYLGILPLFTHSKGSYNSKSLKPVISAPKLSQNYLKEKQLWKFFDNTFLNAVVCRNKIIVTSSKAIRTSISVSKLSNANPSAFKLYTNTDRALGPGYTKKANNLVTSYGTGGATGHLPLTLPFTASPGSAAGNQLYSVSKQGQGDVMWSEGCSIIISRDTMPVCSQLHLCFLQLGKALTW